MKFIALKELPQGQQPGDEFDAPEAQGKILILVGAAKMADDGKPRRRYERRDLEAVEG